MRNLRHLVYFFVLLFRKLLYLVVVDVDISSSHAFRKVDVVAFGYEVDDVSHSLVVFFFSLSLSAFDTLF